MPDTTIGPSIPRYEIGVLGAALWSEEGMTQVLEQAKPHDFADPSHRNLFEVIRTMAEEGLTPDLDMIEMALRQRGSLESLGPDTMTGPQYLDYLHENNALVSNLPHYISNLRSCAGARKMIEVGGTLIASGQGLSPGDQDRIAETVNAAQSEIWELTEETVPQNFETIGSIVTDGYQQIVHGPEDAGEVIPTGFIDLDKKLHGGLKPQQVCIIAARPAVGKSVFGLNVAAHAAINKGIPAVFYSLEMSRLELATRLIAGQAKVPLDRLMEGQITPIDDERINTRIEDLSHAPLYIDDTPGLDISTLASSIRYMKRRFGVKLVVVDYVQLVKGSKSANNRQEEVGEVSRQLKITAKREGVAIIAIAQLNRGPEQRGGKPQISDLRESGTLEQDADIVILLHREDMYDSDSDRKGEADFHLVKQRAGQVAVLPMAFQGHFSMFADMPHADRY